MPIKFSGPVKPQKLKSPDPIMMPVIRDNKVPRVKVEVEYYKEHGRMPEVLGPPAGETIGDADLSVAGDNKAFIDYRTGFEWVRLSVTNSFTLSTIVPELAEGGQFEGFRVAIKSEITSLVETITPGYFAPVQVYSQGTHYIVPAQWNNWNSIQGVTGSAYGRNWSVGVYYDEGETKHAGTDYWYESFRLPNRIMKYDRPVVDYGFMSIFLVSDGGNTLLSQENPHYMLNNPNSPHNGGLQ